MPSPDHQYMDRCLALAAHGAGWVAPNPMVGSVVVSNGEVIGEGFHERYGEPHAEVQAIASVTDQSRLAGSTLYVNLEPCAHHGKTPPCADLLVASRIARVVVGALDPFPQVSGRGVERLRASGIEVEIGVRERECRALNRRFLTAHEKKRPYVVLKWAETTDGFIARSDGSSKWISGEASRALVHRWRSEEQAIIAGTRTILIDDPLLTARLPGAHQPTRIVLDPRGEIPPSAKVFNGDAPTLVISGQTAHPSGCKTVPMPAQRRSIAALLETLQQHNIQSLFVEGGAVLLRAFIDSGLWDEARVFIAPAQFTDGIAAPRIEIRPASEERIENDRLLRFSNSTW